MPRDRDAVFSYRAPPIMAYALPERTHSVLRPVVAEFLAGGTLTQTQLFALRAYIARWIDGKQQTLARLSDEVPDLKNRDDFQRWFAEARCHDFDPVE